MCRASIARLVDTTRLLVSDFLSGFVNQIDALPPEAAPLSTALLIPAIRNFIMSYSAELTR
jgi:hypothetical protein